jgi:hypothetical protein
MMMTNNVTRAASVYVMKHFFVLKTQLNSSNNYIRCLLLQPLLYSHVKNQDCFVSAVPVLPNIPAYTAPAPKILNLSVQWK